jgi:hypothetical protein
MVVANNEIDDNKNCRQIPGEFDGHADVAVQCGTHCLIEHISGFTRSHWMLPSGECLHPIAPAADKVIDFGCKHKSQTNTTFSYQSYGNPS